MADTSPTGKFVIEGPDAIDTYSTEQEYTVSQEEEVRTLVALTQQSRAPLRVQLYVTAHPTNIREIIDEPGGISLLQSSMTNPLNRREIHESQELYSVAQQYEIVKILRWAANVEVSTLQVVNPMPPGLGHLDLPNQRGCLGSVALVGIVTTLPLVTLFFWH